MCGIAGVFYYRQPGRRPDEAQLRAMLAALAHRGPDDEGIWIGDGVGLGNRRLAIVDLSSTGHQPMAGHDERSWLTYNGEFYDHRRWRSELEAAHVFRGTSDTETMLELLTARGPDALANVSAIFGLAWWDAPGRRLVLARDALGVKQLYYHDDGQRILFASEIKALIVDPSVRRELDHQGLNEYLHFHTTLFDRTFFRGIRQLRPGEYLEVDERGIRAETYWSISSSDQIIDVDQASTELDRLLRDVISDQLLSDVPIGAFLSGGIDSSVVATYAARAGQLPLCFGVHFTEPGVIDEGPYQRAVAKALGLELELITVDGSTFAQDFLRALYFQDQPAIGAAMMPMYHVSRLAAQHVKVCLGGQAGDEIFGGYARYALADPLAALRVRRDGAANGTNGIGGSLFKQLRDGRTLRRAFSAMRYLADWRRRYFETFAAVPESAWRTVFDASLVSRATAYAQFTDAIQRSPVVEATQKLMHWDVTTYLPGLFMQDDRMSMANSLESRVPLADSRLVRFAFRVPFALKVRAGTTKWLLRASISDVIPPSVLNRRKVGFATPAENWMRGTHREFVRELLLSKTSRERGILDARGITGLFDDPPGPHWFEMTWKALNVEAWARTFIDNAASEASSHGLTVA